MQNSLGSYSDAKVTRDFSSVKVMYMDEEKSGRG